MKGTRDELGRGPREGVKDDILAPGPGGKAAGVWEQGAVRLTSRLDWSSLKSNPG